VKTFDDCAYKWFLKYIKLPNIESKELFFASYGIFMHELLQAYNNGQKTADQIKKEYLTGFKTHVKAAAPSEAIFKSYFLDGLQYLNSIQPSGNKILSVENKAEFIIRSKPFVGYIDLIEQDNSGSILLIDNKSKVLKPRKVGKKPTKADNELNTYLKQLYLYSHYIFIQYGKFPSKLCFNCFRKGLFIEEPFNQEAYENAIDWFLNKIDEIISAQEFRPSIEYFKCQNICEMQDYCEYYKISKG